MILAFGSLAIRYHRGDAIPQISQTFDYFPCLFLQVSAWGGYVFIINLIPLHVFVLLLMNRYSQRIYVAYNTFFIIGLLCSMQIPFVGFQPVKTSEHMASAGKALSQSTVFTSKNGVLLKLPKLVAFNSLLCYFTYN